MEAALARDADRAVALLTAHMTQTTNILLEAKVEGDAPVPRQSVRV